MANPRRMEKTLIARRLQRTGLAGKPSGESTTASYPSSAGDHALSLARWNGCGRGEEPRSAPPVSGRIPIIHEPALSQASGEQPALGVLRGLAASAEAASGAETEGSIHHRTLLDLP
jgi:hypothetical protein